MKRLKKLLDAWYDGYKIKGIQTPPFATICELEDIYSGIEKTTVNSTVIRFLDLTTTDEEEIEAAKDCKRYEKGDPSWMEDDCPSSTGGDYSPSNPWNAPGMSIRDFI